MDKPRPWLENGHPLLKIRITSPIAEAARRTEEKNDASKKGWHGELSSLYERKCWGRIKDGH